MAINDVVNEARVGFLFFHGPGTLPEDPAVLDSLVRFSTGKLLEGSEKAEEILRAAGPENTARYLAPMLTDPRVREAAMRLFLYFGPSNATVKPLLGALKDPASREYATYLLSTYGARRLTVHRLVSALGNSQISAAAANVLISYGKCVLGQLRHYGSKPVLRHAAILSVIQTIGTYLK